MTHGNTFTPNGLCNTEPPVLLNVYMKVIIWLQFMLPTFPLRRLMGPSFLTYWCVLCNVCFIFTTLPSPLYWIPFRHSYSDPATLSLVSVDFWNHGNSHTTKLISLRLFWQILLLIGMEPWPKLLTLVNPINGGFYTSWQLNW